MTEEPGAPSPFVVDHLPLAPPGPALDVACGRGRHALVIAATGRRVEAIDRDVERCRALAARARGARLPIDVACADLERSPLPLGRYALIVNTLYLDRHLADALARALRPGGLLLFETFSRNQLLTGHPRNPCFVLAPGELPRLFGGLQMLAHRDGPVERDGRVVHLASLAARAP
ncbi:MAG TPA: class I SAM-dependent methyltransferase [Candidatus Binatia bacterium]|nr:class I SAM-dependent methyltransferase [Candidatus Binatia bacterium]